MQNEQLTLAYNYAQYTSRNIFLTGKAGTGKTTFLRHLVGATRKRHIVVAPTGVAAINAGGVTIHSFFQLAPGLYLPGQQIQRSGDGKSRFGFSKHKLNILRSLDLLIIDEISMVRCDLLDAIDDVLRRYQHHDRPFGGVQLLLIGDLQQLAPVTKDNEWELLKPYYRTPYFFDSLALRQTNYTTIELTQVFRQADPDFVDLLNRVRDNRLDPSTLQRLNSRYRPGFRPADDEGYITLTTHNQQAQHINDQRLALLPAPARTYSAEVTGDFPETSYPTEAQLPLKVGEQVMFCKNDVSPDHNYYNGLIGRVVATDKASVKIRIEAEGRDIVIGAQEWQNTRYVTDATSGEIREEVAGTFSQIPLRAAWAITIHKSQGLTFDRAVIDAGRAFSFGQVYVALSRCRSLDGLVLSTPISAGVIMSDPNIIQYNHYIEQNQPTATQLAADRRSFVEELLCHTFDFGSLLRQLRELQRRCGEHIGRTWPRYVENLNHIVDEASTELESVGQRFQQQIRQLMPLAPNYDDNTTLQGRVLKAINYFTQKTADVLGDFFEEGLPEIDSKAAREVITNAFEPARQAYDLHMTLFVKCAHGFSLEAYWDAKAAAAMSEDTREQPSKGAKTTKKKKPQPSAPRKIATDIQDEALYARLSEWRKQKAWDLNLQIYQVMHNATLIAIANEKPATEKELLALPGFGRRMLAVYGREILKIVNA